MTGFGSRLIIFENNRNNTALIEINPTIKCLYNMQPWYEMIQMIR